MQEPGLILGKMPTTVDIEKSGTFGRRSLTAMGNSWERKEYAKVSGGKKPTPTTSFLLLLNKDQFVPSTKIITNQKIIITLRFLVCLVSNNI
jgi:hypothetical protein